MKKIILTLLFLIIILPVGCVNNNQQIISSQSNKNIPETTDILWAELNETTWWYDNSWAGESYVFYKDNNGIKKCIHQMMGSGVYVVSREFVDIEIINKEEIKIDDTSYKYIDDKLISEKNTLTFQSNKPLIYNRMGPVDIGIVKSDDFAVRDIDKKYDNQK